MFKKYVKNILFLPPEKIYLRGIIIFIIIRIHIFKNEQTFCSQTKSA